ncbi:MAG: hypothetical protein ABI995_02020 [Acidobacteriota bacterium]
MRTIGATFVHATAARGPRRTGASGVVIGGALNDPVKQSLRFVIWSEGAQATCQFLQFG